MIVIFDRKKIMKDANTWGDLMKVREMEKKEYQVTHHTNSEMAPQRINQTLPISDDTENQKLQAIKAELRSLGFSTNLVRV